jgi:hypothetical protein
VILCTNSIGLLTSWTCRSQTAYRNGRFVAQQTVGTGDESVCVASRWDAAPDDDTI